MMQAKHEAAVRYLRQRGKLATDQKVHRKDSAAARRERARQDRVPVPAFLLRT